MHITITDIDSILGNSIHKKLFGHHTASVPERYRDEDVSYLLYQTGLVIHNREETNNDNDELLYKTNILLTKNICDTLGVIEPKIPIIFFSNIDSETVDTPYHTSKKYAEYIVSKYNRSLIVKLPYNLLTSSSLSDTDSIFCSLKNSSKITDQMIEFVFLDDLLTEVINSYTKINGSSIFNTEPYVKKIDSQILQEHILQSGDNYQKLIKTLKDEPDT